MVLRVLEKQGNVEILCIFSLLLSENTQTYIHTPSHTHVDIHGPWKLLDVELLKCPLK